jgi:putative flippase GtrA
VKRHLRSLFSREFAVFLFVGGLNTAVTYGIYLGLLLAVSYPIAYSGSYIAGIFISYCLNAWLVFREPLRLASALRYPIVYGVQYVAGLGLLYLAVEVLHLSKKLAPLGVVAVSVPLTFFLSRFVIRGRKKPSET